MALSAASFADFLVLDRFWRVIQKMTAADLNELRIYPSMLNFLAAFGREPSDRLESCVGLASLILAWWTCFAAILVLNPYPWWDKEFELMLLGTASRGSPLVKQ